jgi:hypothetical protein
MRDVPRCRILFCERAMNASRSKMAQKEAGGLNRRLFSFNGTTRG